MGANKDDGDVVSSKPSTEACLNRRARDCCHEERDSHQEPGTARQEGGSLENDTKQTLREKNYQSAESKKPEDWFEVVKDSHERCQRAEKMIRQ